MKLFICVLIVALLLPLSICFAQSQQYEFTKAYIYGIGCKYQLEEMAKSDLLEAGNDVMRQNMAFMRNGQRAMMNLQVAINYLKPYQQSKNELIRNMAQNAITNYGYMILNYKDMVQSIETMSNPANLTKPDFDIGKMMSRVSGNTARQEYISESLFKLTQMVALALTDRTPDKKGICSYLLLTSEEKENLINDLNIRFGDKIKNGLQTGQNYTIASAAALYQFLTNEHRKSSDERPKEGH